MSAFSRITTLVRKEFILEWKQKYALMGILLYALTMVFVMSLAFSGKMEFPVWNILFWTLLLFVAVNAIARSFMGESQAQMYYIYNLAGPREILAAKLIYNCLLMILLSLLTFIFLRIFSAVKPIDPSIPIYPDFIQFCVGVLLSSIAFAANLTLVSAIAAKARNAATLMAVLGFPLLVPQLLMSIGAGKNALAGYPWNESAGQMLFSACFFVIITFVSFILFPFLWRD